MPGKNARNGRRGMSRSPLDMAEDSKNWGLVKWLRAQGCCSGDGSLAQAHMAEWKDKGWQGNSTGSRSWTTSWGSWWGSNGNEPASSSSGHEPKAGEWPSKGKGGGKGGGGGGSKGSGSGGSNKIGGGGGGKSSGRGSSKGSSSSSRPV